MSRTATRTAAVLGAAAALTFAGTGAAMAATTSHAVDNATNTVSVTFEQAHPLDPSMCVAAVTPLASAAELIATIEAASNLDVDAIADLLAGDTPATLLRGGLLNTPVVSLIGGDVEVSATVEPNVYALVAICTSDDEPTIVPSVLVGDPAAAIQGSVGTLSSDGDALGALSSTLGGEDESGNPLAGLLGDTGSGN